jgi:hypothetical protein
MDQEVEVPRFFGSAIGPEKSVGAPSTDPGFDPAEIDPDRGFSNPLTPALIPSRGLTFPRIPPGGMAPPTDPGFNPPSNPGFDLLCGSAPSDFSSFMRPYAPPPDPGSLTQPNTPPSSS